MGDGAVKSRVTIALTQETEAVKVVVTNDQWADDDPAYQQNADGWPRILSRLKTFSAATPSSARRTRRPGPTRGGTTGSSSAGNRRSHSIASV